MRRFTWIVMLAAGAAQAQGPKVLTTVPGYAGTITMDTAGVWHDVSGGHREVFEAVVHVFDALKIPLSIRDTTYHVLGNLQFSKSRTLGGNQMSRYFECGSGLTGPNADTYRVTMAVTVRIAPVDSAHARIRTGVVGGAQNVSGNAYDPVMCATTGGLEALVLERVRQSLAARPARP